MAMRTRRSSKEQKMANGDFPDELAQTMDFVATAISLVSALGVMASQSQNAADAAYAATRHSAQTATLELATTANSAMLILGGKPSQPAATSKNMKKLLQALQLHLDQASGTPVVT